VAVPLFYLLALGAIVFAIGVIKARMPLFSVLCLLGSFFCLSGIYLLAGFQFLAVVQLLVYAGAIMVLFLFVIMLLNLGDEKELEKQVGVSLWGKRLAVAGSIAALLGLSSIWAIGPASEIAISAAMQQHGIDRLEAIARELFGRYMLPFEVASLLLLATIISVITLAKRDRGQRDAPHGGNQ